MEHTNRTIGLYSALFYIVCIGKRRLFCTDRLLLAPSIRHATSILESVAWLQRWNFLKIQQDLYEMAPLSDVFGQHLRNPALVHAFHASIVLSLDLYNTFGTSSYEPDVGAAHLDLVERSISIFSTDVFEHPIPEKARKVLELIVLKVKGKMAVTQDQDMPEADSIGFTPAPIATAATPSAASQFTFDHTRYPDWFKASFSGTTEIALEQDTPGVAMPQQAYQADYLSYKPVDPQIYSNQQPTAYFQQPPSLDQSDYSTTSASNESVPGQTTWTTMLPRKEGESTPFLNQSYHSAATAQLSSLTKSAQYLSACPKRRRTQWTEHGHCFSVQYHGTARVSIRYDGP